MHGSCDTTICKQGCPFWEALSAGFFGCSRLLRTGKLRKDPCSLEKRQAEFDMLKST